MMFKAINLNIIMKTVDDDKKILVSCRAYDSELDEPREKILHEEYTSEEDAMDALDNFLDSWYN